MDLSIVLRHPRGSKRAMFEGPIHEEELRDALDLSENEEVVFVVEESSHNLFPEHVPLDVINKFFEMTESVDDDIVLAVWEMTGYKAVDFVREDFNFEEVILLGDVNSNTELGQYYIDECGMPSQETMERYFDYEKYGQDIDIEQPGGFSSYGYVTYPN